MMIETKEQRYVVKLPTISPKTPPSCVSCLTEDFHIKRPLVFRRSDGTVERVSVVEWPYCNGCIAKLKELDKKQKMMSFVGALQMLVVIYIVGSALGQYDLWIPSFAILALLFFVFRHIARKVRILWDLEWARIEDVYKGGIGASYSFRNRDYATKFAHLNSVQDTKHEKNL